jgi:4-hydroxy-3-methylbut-2-en-1-yl diphosphate reductase
MLKVILADSWGFCFGVERALKLVEKTAQSNPGPIRILNKIVHNSSIVKSLEERNIVSISDLKDAEDGTLVISAHGVAPSVRQEAEKRGLHIVDTTCPLVTRIHKAAKQFLDKGCTVLIYGDKNHNEVKGVVGIAPDRIIIIDEKTDLELLPEIEGPIGFISQSTQSTKQFEVLEQKLREKYPHLEVQNTICDPTVRRQEAIKNLAPQVNMLIVVGSTISSNSLRLLELAQDYCPKSYLIDNASQIKIEWLEGIEKVGITAGASTPANLVREVVEKVYQIYEEHYLNQAVS